MSKQGKGEASKHMRIRSVGFLLDFALEQFKSKGFS